MAIQLIDNTHTDKINAAYTRIPYVVSGSVTTSNPQYQYVMDVYESQTGFTDRFITRVTQTPNPEGVAIFDPSQIFQGELNFDNISPRLLFTINTDAANQQDFKLKFGEQYGTSPSSSITVYPDLITVDNKIISAVIEPSNGISYKLEDVEPRLYNPNPGPGIPQHNELTNNPYIVWPDYNTLPDVQRSNGVVCGKNDYLTTAFLGQQDKLPSLVYIKSYNQYGFENFRGALVKTPAYTDPFPEVSNPLYSVSLDNIGNLFRLGLGPTQLERVPMATEFTSSLGNDTFGEIIESGDWSYYTVETYFENTFGISVINVLNEGTVNNLSAPKPIYHNKQLDYPDTCNKEKLRFIFINKFGDYDYYSNYNPVRRSSNIERHNVTLSQLDFSGNSGAYNVNNRGQKDYDTQIKDVFTVDTPYLNKETANWLEELIESPEVYIQRGEHYFPIIITNSSLQHNNSTSRNKLFQYTIEFEPAKQPYGKWIPEYADTGIVLPPGPTPTPTPTLTPTPTPTPEGDLGPTQYVNISVVWGGDAPQATEQNRIEAACYGTPGECSFTDPDGVYQPTPISNGYATFANKTYGGTDFGICNITVSPIYFTDTCNYGGWSGRFWMGMIQAGEYKYREVQVVAVDGNDITFVPVEGNAFDCFDCPSTSISPLPTPPPAPTPTPQPCTQFLSQEGRSGDASTACFYKQTNKTFAHNGAGAAPEIGDTVYYVTDEGPCERALYGRNGWWYCNIDDSALRVDIGGNVIDKVFC